MKNCYLVGVSCRVCAALKPDVLQWPCFCQHALQRPVAFWDALPFALALFGESGFAASEQCDEPG